MYDPKGLDVLKLSDSDQSKLKGKRIAIIANCTWNIFNFRLNVVHALIAKGAQVFIIAPFDEYVDKFVGSEQLTIVPLYKLKRSSLNPLNDLRLLRELIKIYKKYKPDIVISYTIKPNIYGSFAAGYLKLPAICVITGLGYTFLHKGLLNKIVCRMYKIAFQYPRIVLFENKDDKILFVNNSLVNAGKAYHINGCGVDLNHFSPLESSREIDKINFTFIGRLLFDKGIIEFIKAARLINKTHPEISFSVIGWFDDANPSSVSNEYILSLLADSNIVFRERVEDISPCIASASSIVLPSYREGMPKILMEAMAMAKPIITSDTPGCRDLVEEGFNGFLVKPKEIDSLVEAMLNFSGLSVDARIKMGFNGRNKALAELDDIKIADQIIEHLINVLPVKPEK